MRQGVRKEYLKGSRRNGRGHSPYPFDRLLASRVGRLWDDVFSELCEEFDSRSWAGQSFRRALEYHVATNCWVGAETGTIYGGWYGNSPVENEFYVHPWTGLLCWAPKIDRPAPERPVTHIKIDDTTFLEKVEGIWYRYAITKRWIEKDYWGRDYERTETTRAQLGRKELRARNLYNDQEAHLYPRCKECGADFKCVHRIREEAKNEVIKRGWR